MRRQKEPKQLSKVVIYVMLLGSVLLSVTQSYAEKTTEFDMPVLVNGAFTGNVNAQIVETKQADSTIQLVKVPVARLVELVSSFANDEQLNAWFGTEPNEIKHVSLAELRSKGLDIEFDSAMLSIIAIVPRLGVQALSVRGLRKPIIESHQNQSRFATGLNVYLRNTYSHMTSSGSEKGLGDTNIEMSGFTTIGGFGGWSLFYEAEYSDNEAVGFERKDVKLIHDDYKRGLRYSAGDIRPTVSRFQTSTDMLGLSIERNYTEINPFRNLRPNGRSSFNLERASRVQFEVNGIIVGTEELEPGTYSIEDFPLAIGSNDVRVWIDDGTSRIEAANFSTYVDTTLLADGVTNFGLNLGVQRELGGNLSRSYQDQVALLAYFEKGVKDNLTLGAQMEGSEGHALLASNVIYGTRAGIFAFESAASKRDGHDVGVASLLRYKYLGLSRSNWFVQADLQASYRSDSFMSLAELVARPEEWSLNGRSSFGKDGVRFSFGGELKTVDDFETKRLTATLSKSFRSFSLSLGYQHIDSDLRGRDDKLTLSISKRLGKSSLRAQYKSLPEEIRAEWRSQPARSVGDIRSRVSAVSSDTVDDAELEFGYINSRFEFDMRHATSVDAQSSDTKFSNTNLRLSTALGYADGNFAFGRPFTRGFVVVDRHDNLQGKKVIVTRNSVGGDAVTSTKLFDSTLVPLNSSYRTQRYLFSVNELPIGYDLGSGDVKLYPGNLAGYSVTLGSDEANTMIGRVLSPDNEPLSLMSGKLIPKGDGDEIVVFTNRTGRFVAEKVGVGAYTLVFGTNSEWFSEVVVDDSGEPGLVEVGTIRLQEVVK